jgi:methyl-accepting chemotaxis protein
VAQKAGELLTEIVPSIVKTADLVAEITNASEEQATGANQITMGMNQLNEVTQMTASSAEELASTSEALNEHARGLQKMIGFFRLRESSGAIKETLPETARLKAPVKA